MDKLQIHQFNPEIYPRKIWVVKGGSLKQIIEMFVQTDGKELDLSDVGKYDAITCNVMMREKPHSFGELIWYTRISKMNTDTIAHESVHAAMDIFDDVHCDVDVNNQEPFAYLVGWIADCIDQVRKNKFKL